MSTFWEAQAVKLGCALDDANAQIERLRAELEKERARLDWFAGYGCLVVDGYLTRDLDPPVQIVNGNLRAAIDKAMDEEG